MKLTPHTNLGDSKTILKNAEHAVNHDIWQDTPMLERVWLNWHQMRFHFFAQGNNKERFVRLWDLSERFEIIHQIFLNSFEKKQRMEELALMHNTALAIADEIRKHVGQKNSDPILVPLHQFALHLAELTLTTSAEPEKTVYKQLEQDT